MRLISPFYLTILINSNHCLHKTDTKGFSDDMVLYDDIFSWDGWGGKLRLASGKCRMRIYDLRQSEKKDPEILKPFVVITSDIEGEKMSIRSCSGHIATLVIKKFGIDPRRMLWVEYYLASEYGAEKVHNIPERFDVVEFTWYEGRAIEPKWRVLNPSMVNTIKELVSDW